MDLQRLVHAVIDDRLRQVGEAILQAQEQDLSDPGDKDVHSYPGEAPKRQSGRLANSFSTVVVDGELRLMSDCPYLKYLQDGTAKIAPRDVLAGYHRIKDDVIAIIKGEK